MSSKLDLSINIAFKHTFGTLLLLLPPIEAEGVAGAQAERIATQQHALTFPQAFNRNTT